MKIEIKMFKINRINTHIDTKSFMTTCKQLMQPSSGANKTKESKQVWKY